ncbi:MAG: hypothetical protein OXH75_16390 [Acidobacteria bacterium]|nr:hypothetical protein [Acidobacteriota bacterium]
MRSTVLILAIALLVVPSGATAGPILESALRAADGIVPASGQSQPRTCQQIAVMGEQDGRARQGMGGWFAGGLLLSPFFVPIMPIVAHTTEPVPASDALADLERDDIGCYTTGYVRAAKGKRVRASWIGYGVSIALWGSIIAAAAATN